MSAPKIVESSLCPFTCASKSYFPIMRGTMTNVCSVHPVSPRNSTREDHDSPLCRKGGREMYFFLLNAPYSPAGSFVDEIFSAKEKLGDLQHLATVRFPPSSQLSPTSHKRLKAIAFGWWLAREPLFSCLSLFFHSCTNASLSFMYSFRDV